MSENSTNSDDFVNDTLTADQDDEDSTAARNLRSGGRAALGKNLLFDNNINVYGQFNLNGGHGSELVPYADITQKIASSPRWAEPENCTVKKLAREMSDIQISAVAGPDGIGKVFFAAHCLFQAGCDTIYYVDGNVSPTSLTDFILSLEGAGGVVIDSMPETVLCGSAMAPLEQLLGRIQEAPGVRVIFTLLPVRALSPLRRHLSVFDIGAPDPAEVVRALAHDPAADEVVVAALADFGSQPPPGEVARMVEDVEKGRLLTAAELVERYSDTPTDELISDWLEQAIPADRLSYLAAVATLDGCPVSAVELLAAELADLLSPRAGEVEVQFSVRDDRLPPGLIVEGKTFVGSHFGVHEEEIVSVSPRYGADAVLIFLWRNLSESFRRPYLRWLADRPRSHNSLVRLHAAVAAGVLFSLDPGRIERELLRPWAVSGQPRLMRCAGVSLGVPTALGLESAVARALVHSWGRVDNVSLRAVAVFAYGGEFGAWDAGSSAPIQLWRIGRETPTLQVLADRALAALVAAGGEASSVRSTVLGLLRAALSDSASRSRGFEVAARAVAALCGDDRSAASSLSAIGSDTERSAHEDLAFIITRALTSAAGKELGSEMLVGLLGVTGSEWFPVARMAELIRSMKAQASTAESTDRLAPAVRRILIAAGKSGSRNSAAPKQLLEMFFGKGD